MDNILIGIIAKENILDDTPSYIVSKSNLKYLHNKCNYIGILNYDNNEINKDLLSICDGIIIPGGTNIYPYHFLILDYAIENNIPLLGICMGHQIIGLYSNGSTSDEDLIKVEGHNDKDKLHTIKIIPNSFINKALGDTIKVNTRHSYKVKEVLPPFKETSLSEDNVIESIEYIDDNHFIVGVQFHPEDMNNTENLYNLFIKEILKRKKEKQKI